MAVRTEPEKSIHGGLTASSAAVPALMTLLGELAERRVRFCVWKSNLHLPQALSGGTDLDLLVDRQQALMFREVVARHRSKPLVPSPGRAYPAMEHYLGLCVESGRLYHLHVHYKLILGQENVKDYRVPMEREFLDSTRLLNSVPVPRPELELSVLAVRALLKYRNRDVVKDLFGIRSPGLPEQIRAEMGWLLSQTTTEEVRAVLQASAGPVPPELVTEFLETTVRAPRSGFALFRLRSRLRRGLGEQQRQSRLRATTEYYRGALRRRRRLRRSPVGERMTFAAGGLTFALVGADGSGKSTIVDALARWLRWKLEVRVYYMGSKSPSRRSRWLYLAYRALRRGHRTVTKLLGPASMPTRWVGAARDITVALHHLAIGRDRARRYRAGLRDARMGRVVIFDRFPLESLTIKPEHRLLDGPRISATLGDPTGRLATALAAVEERMYRRFRLPDYLIVLDVSPETAADRKTDHTPNVLLAKSRAVSELAILAEASIGPAGVIRIDADRSLETVLRDIKARLWDVL